MGLDVFTAREDRMPRAACRYQRLRGELSGDHGGEGEYDGVMPPATTTAGSVRVRRPLRLRRRACKAAAGRWRATTTAGSGGKRLLRLRLLRLVLLVLARRVAALLAELVRRLAVAASAVDAAADCPAIVFSSQWGLPVLSHSSSTTGARSAARLRALYLERSLSARSTTGAGAGSPCC